MTRDLTDLLRAATPEPSRSIEPAAVLTRARRQRTRSAAALAVAATILVAAVAVFWPGEQQDTVIPASSPTFSALRELTPLDSVVLSVLSPAVPVHPDRGTKVGRAADFDVFLVQTTAHRLCLLAMEQPSGEALGYSDGSISCARPEDVLRSPGLILSVPDAPETGNYWTFIAVPDGWNQVALDGHVLTVHNNIAIAADPKPHVVRVFGPGKETAFTAP